jgi:plasmid stabilization system protein ParE
MASPRLHPVIILPEAEEDPRELTRYVAARSPSAARALLDHLLEAIEDLAMMPARFPVARESGQVLGDLRQRVEKSFRIIFEIRAGRVEVLGMRHVARRPKAL